MAMDMVRFGEESIANVLARMKPADIDQLPFGVVQVDENGKVIFYNETEGKIVGLSKEGMAGKNFFKDIAPCTFRPEFYGRFREGVRQGDLNVMFEYVFQNDKVQPVKVRVQMKKAISGDTYWIFVKRL